MAAVRIHDLAAALSAEIRSRLSRAEISLSSLARRTALSQPHLSNLLNGKRQYTISTVDSVMLGLGLTTEELLTIALDQRTPAPSTAAAPPSTITTYGRRTGRGPAMHVHSTAPEPAPELDL